MPHQQPRARADTRPNHAFTAFILLVMLGLGAWALHGGASATLSAARLFGG
jgi:hypothetical protein